MGMLEQLDTFLCYSLGILRLSNITFVFFIVWVYYSFVLPHLYVLWCGIITV